MTEKNIQQLRQRHAQLKKFLWISVLLILLMSGGCLWGLKLWLSPLVPTSEMWVLPVFGVPLVAYVGLFTFAIQELRKTALDIHLKQAEQMTTGDSETP